MGFDPSQFLSINTWYVGKKGGENAGIKNEMDRSICSLSSSQSPCILLEGQTQITGANDEARTTGLAHK